MHNYLKKSTVCIYQSHQLHNCFKKRKKMQISRGLGWVAGEGFRDLWRFAFFAFFETVVQLVRLVYANVAFFETVVHLVTFISISLYISLYLFIYLYISMSLNIYLCISLSIYISLYLSVSVYISPYLSLSVYISLYLYISLMLYGGVTSAWQF